MQVHRVIQSYCFRHYAKTQFDLKLGINNFFGHLNNMVNLNL